MTSPKEIAGFNALPAVIPANAGIMTLPSISINNLSIMEGRDPLANFLVTLSAPTSTEVKGYYSLQRL